jgi:hypothetical protein
MARIDLICDNNALNETECVILYFPATDQKVKLQIDSRKNKIIYDAAGEYEHSDLRRKYTE